LSSQAGLDLFREFTCVVWLVITLVGKAVLDVLEPTVFRVFSGRLPPLGLFVVIKLDEADEFFMVAE